MQRRKCLETNYPCQSRCGDRSLLTTPLPHSVDADDLRSGREKFPGTPPHGTITKQRFKETVGCSVVGKRIMAVTTQLLASHSRHLSIALKDAIESSRISKMES